MNRLKKKSLRELAGVSVLCIVTVPAILFMIKMNAQGAGLLVIGLAAGVITIFLGGLAEFRFYGKLDEREKDIYIKGMIFSMFVFVGFWFVFAFGAFFIISATGAIPVGILPLALLGSMLIAQSAETAFLTIYLLKEDDE